MRPAVATASAVGLALLRRGPGGSACGVRVATASALGLALLLSAGAARAQDEPTNGDRLSIELGGYLRSLTALHDAGFEIPGADRRTGLNSEVIRLKWTARWGEDVVIRLHNRFQAQVAITDGGFGSDLVGLGVSAVPGRTLDLSTMLLEDDRLRAWHDVDRLAVTLYTDDADITVGRQAITWGIATLFPVADLWTQFSPFELDTQEKPGVDAVRILTYPADGFEVDAIVADRGSLEDLSAGVRATLGLASADVYAAAGKFWDEAIALGGVAYLLDQIKLRAEAALPWDLDGGGLELPRATLGIDWLSSRLALTGEYHFNGIGAADPGEYAAQLVDPRFQRGESYFLGRHYLGGVASWTPDEEGRLALTLSALANVRDPSATLTPLVSYDLGQSMSLSAGALQSFGGAPAATLPPALRSEFGSYGDLWFMRASVYF